MVPAIPLNTWDPGPGVSGRDKRMQRLHEDDLVGHVLQQGDWYLLKFPAIAEEAETYAIEPPYGGKRFTRWEGEALHPDRESLETLARIREIQGEYNFAGQYQQAPSPLGGGMIKTPWFKTYTPEELPKEFDLKLQSWDTANKSTELSDYSVCTTWGVLKEHLYLLHVLRQRLDYPDLRRAVKQQAEICGAKTILIEDKASGTQLIQDLRADGIHGTTPYEPKMEKVMRMNSVTSTIQNGFVHIPDRAEWLAQYLHEMAVFPNGKYGDQVDSTSQALDWFNGGYPCAGFLQYIREEREKWSNASAANGTRRLPWWTPAFGPIRYR
jgi:predicted phage terminase large subunit-like protein